MTYIFDDNELKQLALLLRTTQIEENKYLGNFLKFLENYINETMTIEEAERFYAKIKSF